MSKLIFFGPVDDLYGPGIKNKFLINILNELYQINVLNTLEGRKKTLLNIIKLCFTKQTTIISVSRGGRKIILPLLVVKYYLLRTKYILIPVGGTIGKECGKSGIRSLFYKIAIRNSARTFVEVEKMVEELSIITKKNNIEYLPNFKHKEFLKDELKSSKENKVVFLSRVCSEKGIFFLLNYWEKNYKSNKIDLDIFGPIAAKDKTEFLKKVEATKGVNYLGVLNNKEVTNVISKYLLMVFPTYYGTEGFPAVILDSIFAVTPILASNASYNNFIINNDFGETFEIDNLSDFDCKFNMILRNYSFYTNRIIEKREIFTIENQFMKVVSVLEE